MVFFIRDVRIKNKSKLINNVVNDRKACRISNRFESISRKIFHKSMESNSLNRSQTLSNNWLMSSRLFQVLHFGIERKTNVFLKKGLSHNFCNNLQQLHRVIQFLKRNSFLCRFNGKIFVNSKQPCDPRKDNEEQDSLVIQKDFQLNWKSNFILTRFI